MNGPDSFRNSSRRAIFEIIENQMRDGTPPETKKTYDRLIADGQSQEVMKMIGCSITFEIFDVLKRNQPYDEERYVAALRCFAEVAV